MTGGAGRLRAPGSPTARELASVPPVSVRCHRLASSRASVGLPPDRSLLGCPPAGQAPQHYRVRPSSHLRIQSLRCGGTSTTTRSTGTPSWCRDDTGIHGAAAIRESIQRRTGYFRNTGLFLALQRPIALMWMSSLVFQTISTSSKSNPPRSLQRSRMTRSLIGDSHSSRLSVISR